MKSTINNAGGSQNNLNEDTFETNMRGVPGVAKMTSIHI